jgi:hypothetical protein
VPEAEPRSFGNSCEDYIATAVVCYEEADADSSVLNRAAEACDGWTIEQEEACVTHYKCAAKAYKGKDCGDRQELRAIDAEIADCEPCDG